MHILMDVDEVLEKLRKKVNWTELGVEWALLFGSLASRGRGRDIDILVKLERSKVNGDIEAFLSIIGTLGEALGLDPSQVDIVELNHAPCPLLVDAWKTRIVIYEKKPDVHIDDLLPWVMVCYDYGITARKLKVVETAIKAARRRWGENGSTVAPGDPGGQGDQ